MTVILIGYLLAPSLSVFRDKTNSYFCSEYLCSKSELQYVIHLFRCWIYVPFISTFHSTVSHGLPMPPKDCLCNYRQCDINVRRCAKMNWLEQHFRVQIAVFSKSCWTNKHRVRYFEFCAPKQIALVVSLWKMSACKISTPNNLQCANVSFVHMFAPLLMAVKTLFKFIDFVIP